MNEVTLTNNNLPSSLDELSAYVLINRQRLAQVKQEVNTIKKLDTAKGVYKQKLAEAQQIAEMVTLAEIKTGELLNEIPKQSGQRTDLQPTFTNEPRLNEEIMPPKPKSEIIKEMGFSEMQVKRMQTMAKHPDIAKKAFEVAKANDDIVSRSLVLNMIKQEQKEAKRQERLEKKEFDSNAPKKNYKLFTCSCGDLAKRPDLIADNSVDFIITDPPYPKEYLYCFDDLAKLALRVLKDGGSLIVMSGQSYLPDIYKMLCQEGLNYQWTLCYSMPGTSTTLWQRKCGTHWKPLIWLVKGEYKGDFIDDIVLSDKSDKDFHEWGQSESGMARIVEKFTYPNQVILDPFVGGGTTGVVAVAMQRQFIGADISHEEVEKTDARICNN